MSTRQYVKLAESLPPRLTRFFARYPPPAILQSSTSPQTSSAASSPSPAAASSSMNEITAGIEGLSFPSPFKCHKHPVTSKWHDPVFSLRRQAELVKLARQHGVEELLPFTVKGTQERIRRREENGLRMKGTGVGQRVKGKESERTLKGRYVLKMAHTYFYFVPELRLESYADDMVQVGEEATGDAGDAEDDPDMETGTFGVARGLRHANSDGREVTVVGGRSGRNRGHEKGGRERNVCTNKMAGSHGIQRRAWQNVLYIGEKHECVTSSRGWDSAVLVIYCVTQ